MEEEFLKNLKEESGHPIKNRAVKIEDNKNSSETKTSVSKKVTKSTVVPKEAEVKKETELTVKGQSEKKI